ncbi:unnamed protein product [Notodromas monacha]|uniref:Uncharacterized protein n=1 Tax=Notodromas monacha TaxID=399045 RepID=A0A7R9BPQ7_9CRUS|nr:unnamed protein product [Notodromas monacha]CAG0918551.1 unnamed protein product [Notodromas monacha]
MSNLEKVTEPFDVAESNKSYSEAQGEKEMEADLPILIEDSEEEGEAMELREIKDYVKLSQEVPQELSSPGSPLMVTLPRSAVDLAEKLSSLSEASLQRIGDFLPFLESKKNAQIGRDGLKAELNQEEEISEKQENLVECGKVMAELHECEESQMLQVEASIRRQMERHLGVFQSALSGIPQSKTPENLAAAKRPHTNEESSVVGDSQASDALSKRVKTKSSVPLQVTSASVKREVKQGALGFDMEEELLDLLNPGHCYHPFRGSLFEPEDPISYKCNVFKHFGLDIQKLERTQSIFSRMDEILSQKMFLEVFSADFLCSDPKRAVSGRFIVGSSLRIENSSQRKFIISKVGDKAWVLGEGGLEFADMASLSRYVQILKEQLLNSAKSGLRDELHKKWLKHRHITWDDFIDVAEMYRLNHPKAASGNSSGKTGPKQKINLPPKQWCEFHKKDVRHSSQECRLRLCQTGSAQSTADATSTQQLERLVSLQAKLATFNFELLHPAGKALQAPDALSLISLNNAVARTQPSEQERTAIIDAYHAELGNPGWKKVLLTLRDCFDGRECDRTFGNASCPTLTQIEAKAVQGNDTSWATHLQASVKAYNSTIHSATNVTSTEAMFGKHTILKADHTFWAATLNDKISLKSIQQHVEQHWAQFIAQANKHKLPQFQPGDSISIFPQLPTVKKHAANCQFCPQCIGPFIVISYQGNREYHVGASPDVRQANAWEMVPYHRLPQPSNPRFEKQLGLIHVGSNKDNIVLPPM